MNAIEKLAENRRRQQALVQRHQEIGKKFQAFAAPHRKACDEKLKREKFGPFLAVERAQEKARKAQVDVLAELQALQKEQPALLAAFDAEMATRADAPVEVDVDLDIEFDAAQAPGEQPADNIGDEFDP